LSSCFGARKFLGKNENFTRESICRSKKYTVAKRCFHSHPLSSSLTARNFQLLLQSKKAIITIAKPPRITAITIAKLRTTFSDKLCSSEFVGGILFVGQNVWQKYTSHRFSSFCTDEIPNKYEHASKASLKISSSSFSSTPASLDTFSGLGISPG